MSDNRLVRLLIGLLVTVGAIAGLSAGAAGGAEVAACRAGDLSASVAFQGATGNLLGGLSIANHGQRTCAIGGRPRLALFRADGRRVALVVTARRPAAAGVEGGARPRSGAFGDGVDPLGQLLRPARAAAVPLSRHADHGRAPLRETPRDSASRARTQGRAARGSR